MILISFDYILFIDYQKWYKISKICDVTFKVYVVVIIVKLTLNAQCYPSSLFFIYHQLYNFAIEGYCDRCNVLLFLQNLEMKCYILQNDLYSHEIFPSLRFCNIHISVEEGFIYNCCIFKRIYNSWNIFVFPALGVF